MKNVAQNIKAVVLGIIVAAGVTYAFAWTGPTATPPNGNVAAPINVGSSIQTKLGGLILNGSTTSQLSTGLTVFGQSIFDGSIQINDGTAGAGKVLQATDSSGDAKWVATSTLGSGTGTAGAGAQWVLVSGVSGQSGAVANGLYGIEWTGSPTGHDPDTICKDAGYAHASGLGKATGSGSFASWSMQGGLFTYSDGTNEYLGVSGNAAGNIPTVPTSVYILCIK